MKCSKNELNRRWGQGKINKQTTHTHIDLDEKKPMVARWKMTMDQENVFAIEVITLCVVLGFALSLQFFCVFNLYWCFCLSMSVCICGIELSMFWWFEWIGGLMSDLVCMHVLCRIFFYQIKELFWKHFHVGFFFVCKILYH